MCSDSFFLGHIYIHTCVWVYVSTWDLLHLLFYQGWHKAVYILLYLEQVWEFWCPAFPARMWPPQLESHIGSFSHSLSGGVITDAMCTVTASRTALLQRALRFPLQAVSQSWQRCVCTHLGSGGRFSLSSVTAEQLRKRTFPPLREERLLQSFLQCLLL